jgi:cold shock CspA family protein
VEVSVRVYAHYKSLYFDPPRMQLRKGERVRVLVETADRGPRAVRVEVTGVS